MRHRHRLTAVLLAAGCALVPVAGIASAAPDSGCNGLYEVARFRTFQQVGDTHGHETVHHQFEAHGCVHDH